MLSEQGSGEFYLEYSPLWEVRHIILPEAEPLPLPLPVSATVLLWGAVLSELVTAEPSVAADKELTTVY